MGSNKKNGRIIGVLFLLNFIIGIFIYQFLQGPILFGDDFLTTTSSSSNKIIISTLLGVLIGVLSIIIAIILLPIFKRYSFNLAFLYFASCILYFIAISIDNISVLSMLELSREYVKNDTSNAISFEILETLLYKRHWWTHYFSLLISSFPVFILYYTLYFSKLVPRTISIIGIIAAILLFIEILFSIFGHSISMNMLIPIGLIQLILPVWLLIKGLNSQLENTSQTAE